MARTMEGLRYAAILACKLRGHKMGNFHYFDDSHAESKCKKCGADVMINKNPSPNEIDIGGEAIALNCK